MQATSAEEICNLTVFVIQNKLSGLLPTTHNSVRISSEDINIKPAFMLWSVIVPPPIYESIYVWNDLEQ